MYYNLYLHIYLRLSLSHERIMLLSTIFWGDLVIVWWLDLQLPVQSVPITTKVVSMNPFHGEVCTIQHFVIKFVSDMRQVSGFLQVLRFPAPKNWPTETLLKVAFNTKRSLLSCLTEPTWRTLFQKYAMHIILDVNVFICQWITSGSLITPRIAFQFGWFTFTSQ